MADCAVIILLYNKAKEQIIQSQYIEIKHLEESSLRQISTTTAATVPQMLIKTGNRVHRVSLKDIIWIQSDDYCSKIHTRDDQSFSLRKSLKSLEEELQPYGFIRIHRSALLNVKSINQLNLDKAVVRLENDLELPVSKSRVKSLRQSLAQTTI